MIKTIKTLFLVGLAAGTILSSSLASPASAQIVGPRIISSGGPVPIPPSASEYPYVSGTQIVTGNGSPLLWHGAQIETSFNVMNAWKDQQRNSLYPTNLANPSVFSAMSQQWHMNALRFPIAAWVYFWDSSPQGTHTYLPLLDKIIQQANDAGLYVILDLHDDQRAESPYADPGSQFRVATPEDIGFWKVIASRYKGNSHVVYDMENEPYETPDWPTWYKGGAVMDTAITPNKTVQAVGMQDLVDAVRSTGSRQIVIVESWQKPTLPNGAFNGMPSEDLIQDPTGNTVYSYHTYQIASLHATVASWDSLWGPVLGKFPLLVGEWAYLPDAYQKTIFMCMDTQTQKPYTASQATQGVTNFLNYLEQKHINWIAWEFDQFHLIQDEATFAPTQLSDAEASCCGAGPSTSCNYGMGTLIKDFLSKSPIGR